MSEEIMMGLSHIIFLVLSGMTLGAALLVVTKRNLLHSALFMIVCFVGIAGLYILLEAEFLAAVQVLIYVGAIATLIIFAIMLTRRLMHPDVRQTNQQWWMAAIVAGLFFVGLIFVLLQVDWPTVAAAPSPDVIGQLGLELMQTYVLPFEVASVLLLSALIGAIIIARER